MKGCSVVACMIELTQNILIHHNYFTHIRLSMTIRNTMRTGEFKSVNRSGRS